MSDKVPREQDHVCGKGIDMADDMFEEEWFGELVEVDIADLCDAEAMEGAGKIGDGEGAGDEIELVSGNFARVEGKSSGGRSCADKEMAAGDAGGVIGINAGHKP